MKPKNERELPLPGVAAGVCSHMAFLTSKEGPHDSYPAELLAKVWPVQRNQGRVCAPAEVHSRNRRPGHLYPEGCFVGPKVENLVAVAKARSCCDPRLVNDHWRDPFFEFSDRNLKPNLGLIIEAENWLHFPVCIAWP